MTGRRAKIRRDQGHQPLIGAVVTTPRFRTCVSLRGIPASPAVDVAGPAASASGPVLESGELLAVRAESVYFQGVG